MNSFKKGNPAEMPGSGIFGMLWVYNSTQRFALSLKLDAVKVQFHRNQADY